MKIVRDDFGIPVLDAGGIEDVADYFLKELVPDVVDRPMATPLFRIVEKLEARSLCTLSWNQNLGRTPDGYRCLGYYSPKRKHIAIDQSVERSDPRFVFTCAHEMGHFFLHNSIDAARIVQTGLNDILDSIREITTARFDRARPRTVMEWQANRFAAGILMPSRTVHRALCQEQKELGITRVGRVWLDNQPQNQRDFHHLVQRIASIYSVSRMVVRFRLRELGFIEEPPTARPASVGDLLGPALEEIFQTSEGM